jgi:hypothetical protein
MNELRNSRLTGHFMRSMIPQLRAGAGLLLPVIAVLMMLLSVFLPKACASGRHSSVPIPRSAKSYNVRLGGRGTI